MNIIERYIAAYIVHCLFPMHTASQEHLDYVYQVLRETGSNPKNPLLRQVLDFIRQSDPADSNTQSVVKSYIASALFNTPPEPTKHIPTYTARSATDGIATAFIISKDNHPVAFAGCMNDSVEECKSQLRAQFNDIEFQDI